MESPTPNDVVAACPECGHSLVDFSEIVDTAECRGCSWKGKKAELLAIPISHTMGSKDDVAGAFVMDFRRVLSQEMVLPIARFLKRWGFLPEKDPGDKVLATILNRYLRVFARSFLSTLLTERAAIERERIAEEIKNG